MHKHAHANVHAYVLRTSTHRYLHEMKRERHIIKVVSKKLINGRALRVYNMWLAYMYDNQAKRHLLLKLHTNWLDTTVGGALHFWREATTRQRQDSDVGQFRQLNQHNALNI